MPNGGQARVLAATPLGPTQKAEHRRYFLREIPNAWRARFSTECSQPVGSSGVFSLHVGKRAAEPLPILRAVTKIHFPCSGHFRANFSQSIGLTACRLNLSFRSKICLPKTVLFESGRGDKIQNSLNRPC